MENLLSKWGESRFLDKKIPPQKDINYSFVISYFIMIPIKIPSGLFVFLPQGLQWQGGVG